MADWTWVRPTKDLCWRHFKRPIESSRQPWSLLKWRKKRGMCWKKSVGMDSEFVVYFGELADLVIPSKLAGVDEGFFCEFILSPSSGGSSNLETLILFVSGSLSLSWEASFFWLLISLNVLFFEELVRDGSGVDSLLLGEARLLLRFLAYCFLSRLLT